MHKMAKANRHFELFCFQIIRFNILCTGMANSKSEQKIRFQMAFGFEHSYFEPLLYRGVVSNHTAGSIHKVLPKSQLKV